MASFDENSFGKDTAFSSDSFDFGAVVDAVIACFRPIFRPRRR